MWYFNLNKSCQFHFCEGASEALRDAVCQGGEGWVLTGLLGGGQLMWGWGRALATSCVLKSRAEGNAPSLHFGFILNTPELDGKQILSSLPNSTEMTIWKEKYKKKAATLFGILLTPKS